VISITMLKKTFFFIFQPWRRGVMASSPPATEETGAMYGL
jgi:hypothetical protein